MAISKSQYYDINQTLVDRLTGSLPSSSTVAGPDDQHAFLPEILQIFCPDGKMTPSACAKIMNFTQKETLVAKKCDLKKIKCRPDDGRVYLIINRKAISSTSYPGLIDKLHDHFYGIQNVTLEVFFETWMVWRESETSTSEKTIKEDRFLWNALLKDAAITKVPIRELKPLDYITYFRSITKGRTLTRKRFNNLKSILNGMLYLAVEKGIIERNCLRDINYKQFTYKTEDLTTTPYTEEERLMVIRHLSANTSDIYSLAILLDFHLVLRIGELKALKWSDIHGNRIYIHQFVNYKKEIIEDIKGHTEQGKRFMPLTPAARDVLASLRKLNPDGDYILMRNGEPISTSTFNRRLKKCCGELGIEYRSSHKLRFSTASIMYKNGVEDTELQKLLGHTTLSMTRHYLKNIASDEETAAKMGAILG